MKRVHTRVSTDDIDSLAYAIKATNTSLGATSVDRTHFDTEKVLNWLAINDVSAHSNLADPDYFERCLWFV